eukprot:5357303-Pleurochrysis_carterae.AAC.1
MLSYHVLLLASWHPGTIYAAPRFKHVAAFLPLYCCLLSHACNAAYTNSLKIPSPTNSVVHNMSCSNPNPNPNPNPMNDFEPTPTPALPPLFSPHDTPRVIPPPPLLQLARLATSARPLDR